ncbi:heme/hemin ABC transporter substrate-binding protein [Thalassospira povalilytica]|uniref:heme/hemin ABC transporter substrate-binding protein n=1 Tax=Thalassospira povalilytica TaxID=732237 RepID=UPI001D19283D|nr:ABC transporter substrate-binding protein [Thalassospira povalilytica]MCC4239768.1 ABC transporter substrate-binding protein [Thalassospira povalilytica]
MRRFIAFLIVLTAGAGLAVPSHADERPARVITVGAPATEIVFALGAGDSVVATDTTSTRPDPVPTLPKVGYMRQLASEGIISLKPDLVVAVEKSGPENVLQELGNLGIPVVKLPSLDEIKNLPDAIAVAGKALGRDEDAKSLIQKVRDDISGLAARNEGGRPSIIFLMAVGHGKPLSAGSHTTASEIIDLIGGTNPMASFDGFKPVSPEIIAADQSDYVLVPQSTVDHFGGLDGLKTDPVLGLNKAVANGKVLTVSSSTILGFGPESASEIRDVAKSLHQQEHGQ